MFTSIVLPFIGLLSLYHTFCTLFTYIPNNILLILCTVLTIFLQIVFVHQILPYNSEFNTKYLLIQYIYPLWQTYYCDQSLNNTMLPTPFFIYRSTSKPFSYSRCKTIFKQHHISLHKTTPI